MWNIHIHVNAMIEGCPVDGIEAIKFREQHGIFPRPTNKLTLWVDFESEALCRRYPHLLDTDADLVISSSHTTNNGRTMPPTVHDLVLPPAILGLDSKYWQDFLHEMYRVDDDEEAFAQEALPVVTKWAEGFLAVISPMVTK